MKTALIVIIPEGVETLYNAAAELQEQQRKVPSAENVSEKLPEAKDDDAGAAAEEEHHHHHEHQQDNGFIIGTMLVLGFGLMFIIEQVTAQFGSHHHHHAHSSRIRFSKPNMSPMSAAAEQIELGDVNLTSRATLPHRPAHVYPASPTMTSVHSPNVTATMTGILIHCAADGIAMGAASASTQSQLQILVFFAILLHKAPTAFALATYLMNVGNLSRRRTRHQMLLFSASAPIAALVTFLFLQLIALDATGMMKWTGMLLLFSAGSFLYVATVHILPEVLNAQATVDRSSMSPRDDVSLGNLSSNGGSGTVVAGGADRSSSSTQGISSFEKRAFQMTLIISKYSWSIRTFHSKLLL